MRKSILAAVAGSSIIAITATTPVLAQVTGPTSPENQPEATLPTDPAAVDDEEIVITGTQIRGIAPPGANILTMNEEQIQATGATSTQQLLAEIPQTSAFNNLAATLPGQGVAAGVTRVPIARPNIRNLPGCAGSGSGACTLILIDGHRIVPAGIEQTAVDPSVIPPGIIERVDVILDGNSAIYGSDAIGGVINFITRKRFDGVRVDGRYGIGDSYQSFDANATVGVGWGSGSVVATYSFGKNDAVFGRDRDYIKGINWATGLPTGNQCDVPNVALGAATFASPGFAPGTLNRCDTTQDATLFPKNRRHTGFVSLSQDISDGISFDLTGFYSDFRTESNTGPFRGTATVRSTSPFFATQGFVPPPGTSQYSVLFSYGPAFGNESGSQVVGIKAWQVTPSLTADIGGDWQVGALFTYGHSETTTDAHSINPVLGATLPFNPFNIASTNSAILDQLNGWFDRGSGINKMYNGRVKADGTLFTLPGGGVKAAIGLEYQKNKFTRAQTNILVLSNAFDPSVSGSVESKSVFGELFVPIVGADNEMGGIHRLNLSLSGRYDHYDQDVGGTFNPKIALTYEPIDWITIRANWGKSFNAPSPADRVSEILTRVQTIPCGNPCAFAPTDVPLPPSPGYNIAFATGTVPGLTPQKSKNWSIGADVRPPFVDNLVLGVTYYNIEIKDFISFPQFAGDVQQAFRDFPESIFNYTEISADPTTTAGLPTVVYNFCNLTGAAGVAACQAAAANGLPFAALVDNRTRNLGLFKISGLDFSVTYRHEVNFGSLDLRYSANYQLKRDVAPHPGDPFADTLFTVGVPDFTSSLSLGADVGNARFQATWQHTGKYDFRTTPGINLQDSVQAFDTVDLFFRYDVPGTGLMEDLALTLNINNALDSDPPLFLTTTGGNGAAPNIRTLGRVVLFGLEKKF